MAVATQEVNVNSLAADILNEVADTIEVWADNPRSVTGPQATWRRAFNIAHDLNVEAPTAGETFDAVEDGYSDALLAALDANLGGKNAAQLYRVRAGTLED